MERGRETEIQTAGESVEMETDSQWVGGDGDPEEEQESRKAKTC